MPLLSRAEVFAKKKAVLTKSLQNLNYPCYHEVNISQKYGWLYEVIENSHCPYYGEVNFFSK